jgi:hypothetical protein
LCLTGVQKSVEASARKGERRLLSDRPARDQDDKSQDEIDRETGQGGAEDGQPSVPGAGQRKMPDPARGAQEDARGGDPSRKKTDKSQGQGREEEPVLEQQQPDKEDQELGPQDVIKEQKDPDDGGHVAEGRARSHLEMESKQSPSIMTVFWHRTVPTIPGRIASVKIKQLGPGPEGCGEVSESNSSKSAARGSRPVLGRRGHFCYSIAGSE